MGIIRATHGFAAAIYFRMRGNEEAADRLETEIVREFNEEVRLLRKKELQRLRYETRTRGTR